MIKTSSIWENRKIVTKIVGDVSSILRNSDGIGYPVNWVTQDCSCSYFVGTGVLFGKRSNTGDIEVFKLFRGMTTMATSEFITSKGIIPIKIENFTNRAKIYTSVSSTDRENK